MLNLVNLVKFLGLNQSSKTAKIKIFINYKRKI